MKRRLSDSASSPGLDLDVGRILWYFTICLKGHWLFSQRGIAKEKGESGQQVLLHWLMLQTPSFRWLLQLAARYLLHHVAVWEIPWSQLWDWSQEIPRHPTSLDRILDLVDLLRLRRHGGSHLTSRTKDTKDRLVGPVLLQMLVWPRHPFTQLLHWMLMHLAGVPQLQRQRVSGCAKKAQWRWLQNSHLAKQQLVLVFFFLPFVCNDRY